MHCKSVAKMFVILWEPVGKHMVRHLRHWHLRMWLVQKII